MVGGVRMIEVVGLMGGVKILGKFLMLRMAVMAGGVVMVGGLR